MRRVGRRLLPAAAALCPRLLQQTPGSWKRHISIISLCVPVHPGYALAAELSQAFIKSPRLAGSTTTVCARAQGKERNTRKLATRHSSTCGGGCEGQEHQQQAGGCTRRWHGARASCVHKKQPGCQADKRRRSALRNPCMHVHPSSSLLPALTCIQWFFSGTTTSLAAHVGTRVVAVMKHQEKLQCIFVSCLAPRHRSPHQCASEAAGRLAWCAASFQNPALPPSQHRVADSNSSMVVCAAACREQFACFAAR